MSYFPHAFEQIFVSPDISFTDTGKTDALTPGAFGFYDTKTWAAIPLADASITNHPTVALVMGSYHPKDTIGAHGGYQESLKSKAIDPKHVRRFYKVGATTPTSSVADIGSQGNVAGTAPTFLKGKEYLLRIDLKGSPALRFVTHNLYHTFSASHGNCIDTCVDPCSTTGQRIDYTMILLSWAEQINNHPILSKFISAKVWSYLAGTLTQVDRAGYVEVTSEANMASVYSYLRISAAYVDTRFGNCSFHPADHYEMEPLEIYASLVDEGGNPCKIPTAYIKTTTGKAGSGLGETILRELILFNRYRQEPFQQDPRRREIERSDVINLDVVTRDAWYDSYYLLYSVPRHSNPTSMHDSDQYMLRFIVKQGSDASSFVNWLQAYLTSAGSTVKLEDLTQP